MKLKHKLPTATLFDEISAYWTEIANANATKKQIDFVRNNVNPEGLVLDLGCGTGRHAVPLCEAGYGMVGLDISMRLLQIAKKKAAEAGASPMWVRSGLPREENWENQLVPACCTVVQFSATADDA